MTCVRCLTLLITFLIGSTSFGAGLYEVTIRSAQDAQRLASIEIELVARVAEGYLVLAEIETALQLAESGLSAKLVASGITRDQLATDKRRDRLNVEKYPLLYEDGGLRLFRVNFRDLIGTGEEYDLAPLRTRNIEIEYREPRGFNWDALSIGVDLDSLIDLVEKDSLISYADRMEAFYRRVAGTDSNYACADWLIDKYQEFGYDSVVSDTFTGIYGDEPILFENVIAYKIGSIYPGRHIVIGAHRDAVPNSPGADDDASGVVSTLEIARVLRHIETPMTLVFVAFDGEEIGLYGSFHYADAAAAREDSILYMLNTDMCGHYENTDTAWSWYCIDSTWADLWRDLADSLVGLVGIVDLRIAGSDHGPFVENGYPILFPDEWIFSTVYHSPRDSTTYLSFDYMTKITQISLATVYASMLDAIMPTLKFTYPSGVPRFVSPGDAIIRGIGIESVNDGETVPGSAKLHYSHNGAQYQTIQLTEISDNLYECVIPDVLCGDTIDCYFSAEEATTGLVLDPDSLRPMRLDAATQHSVIFDESFETDNGWVVWGDAEYGQWERAVPLPTGPASAPSEDFDGSGHCYLTDNGYVNTDVDNGSTVLTSPLIDLPSDDARIRYARWYDTYNGTQPDQDSLVVLISNDAGMNWTLVETVGPVEQASGGWYIHEFWVSEFVSPTSMLRLRFIASDLGDGNRVEAAIDAVLVSLFECDYTAPQCGDADSSGEVDVDDVVYLINFVFTSGPPPNPLDVGDVNCSGVIDIDDVVYLITYIFSGGNAPCDTDGDEVPDC
jgi:hypothetical protein